MAKITGTLQDETIVGNFDEKDRLNGALGNDVLYGYGDGSGIGEFTDVAVLASYPNVTVDELVAGGDLQLVGSI